MIRYRSISLLLALAAGITAATGQKPLSLMAAPIGGPHGTVRIPEKEQAVSPVDVTHIGGFEGNRLAKNQENDLHTFPIGKYVGLMETRDFTGWDWRQGEQPGKWLEASILTAARTRDTALYHEAHAMYERIIRSQAPDGYIGITAQRVRTPEKPLGGMDAYELYFLEHALLTAYEVWKDPRALHAAERLGDYFLHYIGPGKAEFWPSPMRPPKNKDKTLKGSMHSEIAGHSIHYSWEGTLLIDPMTRLYELSGDRRYFDWCRWVVNSIDRWSGWDAYSNLDKVAAGEMPINKIQPYVHAHTFQMNFLGLLRMYQVSGDSSYLRKVIGAWQDVASRQRYITGGVSVGEHYERDHVLPLTGEMMETCATMSWMQLSQALLDITGDPKYADAIERIQWNNVFAEQTIDGNANHYFSPPNGYTPRGYFREPDCCMSSGPRLISMLPGFIYAEGPKQTIYVNQFVASTTTIGKTRITQQTAYPEDGAIDIIIDPAKPAVFAVKVRIPRWVDSPDVKVNGVPVEDVHPGSYATITRVWHPGDEIVLDLPMHPHWVRHAYYMKTSDRKPYKTAADADAPYALVRGPVVYAVDDIWYRGDTSIFSRGRLDSMRLLLTDPKKLVELSSPDKNILGPGYELQLLTGAGGGRISIPVYPWANIGKWYRDPAHKPDSNSAAWSYAIWLKGVPDYPEHVSGRLSMPYIFGNNMVLQRNAPVPVWGMAQPGAEVTVRFQDQTRGQTLDQTRDQIQGQTQDQTQDQTRDQTLDRTRGQTLDQTRDRTQGQRRDQTKTAIADGQGRWRVNLDPMQASAQPSSLLVSSGDDGLMMRNILVGDVWFCSGQSNMEYSMRKNSKFEHALRGSSPPHALDSADNPDIRLFLVRPNYSKPDYVHIRRAWDTAEGAPLRDFSAAGYFFATDIYEHEHVPIGLISNAVPGSQIEPFLPGDGKVGGGGSGPDVGEGGGDGKGGGHGAGTDAGEGGAGKFYKTIVEPLAPYALKGFLWYQGESNCFLNDTARYPEKMKTLITGWRKLWGNADLPFYYVQIAPFYYSHSNGGNQSHAPTLEPAFWEAQARALELPHTGMVVTTDLVDSAQELHPPYKWEVGRRLALLALANDYHQPVVCSGPTFQSLTTRGKTLVLTFTNVGSGLVSHDGKPLDWFEVAGTDGKFVPAKAAIQNADEVIIKAKHKPVAVRFGWNEAAQPNLFNKEGLPAMPFRATVNASR